MKTILFIVLLSVIFTQSCLDNTHCKAPTTCHVESQQCYLHATQSCTFNNKCHYVCPEGTKLDPKLSFDLGFGVCTKLGSFGSSPKCKPEANDKCVPCYQCSGFDTTRPCIPCLTGTGGNTLLPCIPTWKGQICTPPTIPVSDNNGVVIKHTCSQFEPNCCPDVKCKNQPSGGKKTGGCCRPGGTCITTTFIDCLEIYNGAYLGDDVICTNPCSTQSFGTCTLRGGFCSTKQSQAICEANNGVYNPFSNTCSLQ